MADVDFFSSTQQFQNFYLMQRIEKKFVQIKTSVSGKNKILVRYRQLFPSKSSLFRKTLVLKLGPRFVRFRSIESGLEKLY